MNPDTTESPVAGGSEPDLRVRADGLFRALNLEASSQLVERARQPFDYLYEGVSSLYEDCLRSSTWPDGCGDDHRKLADAVAGQLAALLFGKEDPRTIAAFAGNAVSWTQVFVACGRCRESATMTGLPGTENPSSACAMAVAWLDRHDKQHHPDEAPQTALLLDPNTMEALETHLTTTASCATCEESKNFTDVDTAEGRARAKNAANAWAAEHGDKVHGYPTGGAPGRAT